MQAAASAPADENKEAKTLALVDGKPLTALPHDLFIPPAALEVFLETFEGPLDLLLYLIRHQNLDILEFPVAEITRQYMKYVDLMHELHLDLAADYLVMSAILAEIKSRMLLPRPAEAESEEDDPRAELVRRLQEYERFKQAAEEMDALPQLGRDIFAVDVELAGRVTSQTQAQPSLQELLKALHGVLARAELYADHHVQQEALSVRERMSCVLEALQGGALVQFSRLFSKEEGRAGVVVSFLAILELLRGAMIELVQNDPYDLIYVKVMVLPEAAEPVAG